jgi:hypothetical protein
VGVDGGIDHAGGVWSIGRRIFFALFREEGPDVSGELGLMLE